MRMNNYDSERDLLSDGDWMMILESLRYTKLKFEDYEGFPSNEYRQERVNEITRLVARIQSLLDA